MCKHLDFCFNKSEEKRKRTKNALIVKTEREEMFFLSFELEIFECNTNSDALFKNKIDVYLFVF